MKNISKNLVLQIADDLRKKIDTGEIPASGRIFSARQLAGLYNCSHQTANSALNLLANEGAITRKHGSGSFRKKEIARPKIACLLECRDISDFSTYSYLVKHLLLLLEKNQCDYQLFSFQDLKNANFSPHIFRSFDGLIVDTRFTDHNSKQLIYEFDRPKLWPWPTFYQLATGSEDSLWYEGFVFTLSTKDNKEDSKNGIMLFRVFPISTDLKKEWKLTEYKPANK